MNGKSIAFIIVIAVITHHGIDQVQLDIRAIKALTRLQERAGLQEIVRTRSRF